MVGAGNMGGAMVRGWIASGSVDPERTSLCTRNDDKARAWQDEGLAEVCFSLQRILTRTALQVPCFRSLNAHRCRVAAGSVFLIVSALTVVLDWES